MLDVLAKCVDFVGGRAVSLYSKDVVVKAANLAYTLGVEPRY